jgi:hypothetical protein
MNTQNVVAPTGASPDISSSRRGMPSQRRRLTIAGAAGLLALAGIVGACTNGNAPTVPLPSGVPSIDASAAASVAAGAASAAAGAALTALDQVDSAIAANQTSGALSADDASSLTQLTSAARTALQSGDTTAAKTAVDNLSTKVDSFASKLSGDAGTQLKNAIAALKSAMPTS